MSESLFRKEALESNKTKMIGSVALYCPPYRWLVISIVGVITVAIACLFVFGSYTKRETAVGELLPVGGVLTVSPPVSGTVVNLPIFEGQKVKKGQPLIEISSEVATSLGGTRLMVADQLELQRTRIKSDLASLDALNKEATDGFKERIALLKSQLKQTDLQRKQRIRQIQLARTQLDKMQEMQKQGYASNTQVEQQEATVLDTDSRLQETTRQQLDLQQQIAQALQQLREQPLNALNQQHEMQSKLSDIEQQLAENESRRSIVLQAPQDSVVGTVLVKQGQIVNASQSVISLLPANGKLQARMMVSSRSIGFIQPGQKVVLRYQAYPYQKFGQQYGHVTEVSRTALSPQEVATLTGNTDVREQHYRVVVDLDKQDIVVYGKTEHLKPGSALEADFLIDKRRLIEWVLEPLFALGRRSAS